MICKTFFYFINYVICDFDKRVFRACCYISHNTTDPKLSQQMN
jgi:hypothetical protein